MEVGETVGIHEPVGAQISTHLVEAHEVLDLTGQRFVSNIALPQDPA